MRKLLSRAISLGLCLALSLGLCPVAGAAGVVDSGVCGESLTWSLNDAGELRISGTGVMNDYAPYVSKDKAPWRVYEEEIASVVVEEGVNAIGHYAFMSCTALTQVSLPQSLTTIGHSVFEECTALTSVVIPESVTVMGSSVFERCSSLTDVTLPQRMDDDLYGTFKKCSALKSVVVPEGITALSATFSECTALERVTLPQSLTEIGGYSFVQSGLEEIIVPPNVTRIGFDAFDNCSKLKKVELPEGLERIEGYAFCGCSALTELKLPSTLKRMGGRVFAGCGVTRINIPVSLESAYGTYDGRYSDSSFGLYSKVNTFVLDEGRTVIQDDLLPLGCTYILPDSITSIGRSTLGGGERSNIFFRGTQAQWEAIEGHETENIGTLRVFFGDEELAQEIPRDAYLIQVVDQEGKAYKGVTIKGGGVNYLTDEKGYASIILGEGRELPPLEFWCDGWRMMTRYGRMLDAGETGETVVVRRFDQSVADSVRTAPQVSACRFSTRADMSGAVELTTRNQMVDVNQGGNIYLQVSTTDDSAVERVELRNYHAVLAEMTPGQITAVPVESLSTHGSYSIRVTDKEGEHTTRLINLIPTEQQFEEFKDLSLDFDKFSVSVGENVPFVGGGELKLEMPLQLPMVGQYDAETSTYRVGINMKDGFSESNFQAMKECVSALESAGSTLRRGGLSGLKRLAGDAFESALTESDDPLEIIIAGYLEAQGNGKGSLDTLRGQLVVGMELKGNMGFTTWVAVVPVTVQVELGLEAKAVGSLTYRVPTQTLTGSLDLMLKPSLEAFGGVGVGRAIGVGAYGKAELEMTARLLGSPAGVRKVALTGELGIKAYLGPLEYSKGYASATWQIYPKGKSQEEEAALFDLYDAQAYQRQDLSYLKEESAWQEFDQASLFAAPAGTSIQTLLSGTYRNAQPSLAAVGDGMYAAFLRADADNGDTYVAVSKYDGSIWSEPARCDAAAVMDGAPRLEVADDGTVWLAFTQTAPDYDPDELLSYAGKQSLVVGTVDPDTCAFTEKARYQGEGYLHLAQLGSVGGQPRLAWVDSPVTDDNSVLWPASGAVCTAAYEGGAWGVARQAVQADKTITSLAVGERAGALALAYVADMDGEGDTHSDKTLYCWDGADVRQMATNVQGRLSFAVIPGAGADFIWNGAEGLYTASGLAVPAGGLTGEYALTDDRLYYSAAGDGSADLTAVIWSGGSWSAPVTLTGGERYLENLNVATYGGKDYLLGMYTNASLMGTRVEDTKDLVWASVEPRSDLRLEVGEVEGAMIAGEYTRVPVTVYNAGDHDVTEFYFTSGARLIDAYIDCSPALAPGQSWTGKVGMKCPETYTSYTLSVNGYNGTDAVPEDNAATVELGMADLAVELVEQRVEGNSSLVALVHNEGIDQATARGQFVNARGEVLGSFVVTDLAAGGTAMATCDALDGSGDYTVRLMSLDPDRYSYNNSATLYVDQPSRILSVEPDMGRVTVEVDAGQAGQLWCGLYDTDGRLLAVTAQAVSPGRQTVELGGKLPTGQTAVVKAFLLGADSAPQCEEKYWER